MTHASTEEKIHASSEVEMLEKLEEIYHKEKHLTGMTTLKELFPIWFDYKENLQAELTMKRYKSDWKKYIEDSNIANIPLSELKNPDLKLWAASTITKYGLDKHAYTNISGIVSQLLEYANDLELIDKTFTKLSKAGKGLLTQKSKKTDGSKIFRADELIAIRKMAMDEFQHPNVQRKFELAPLALLMMSQTGLRISEVCCLEWNDLAEDKAHIRVQRMFRRDPHIVIYHTKGTYGSRDVVVTDEVRNILQLAKERQLAKIGRVGRYIFSYSTDEDGNDIPCSYKAIERLYPKYCKNLGLTTKRSHTMRRTVISMWQSSNVSIDTIRN